MKCREIKKLHSAFLFVFSALILIGCQKEVDPNILSGTGGSGGGNGTGTGTKTSYNPLTPGSWWKYKDSASGANSTGTIVNRTKTINNVLYTAWVSDNGTQKDTAWAASPQPNYYLSEKGVSPNTGAFYDMTFHYLNDTASVGYTWQYTAGQGNGFVAYMQASIEERNITMTVLGKSYNNVIHTKLVLSYDIFGTVMDFMSYDYFTAKGIGIIKVRSTGEGMLAGFTACSDLIDYSIK